MKNSRVTDAWLENETGEIIHAVVEIFSDARGRRNSFPYSTQLLEIRDGASTVLLYVQDLSDEAGLIEQVADLKRTLSFSDEEISELKTECEDLEVRVDRLLDQIDDLLENEGNGDDDN